MAQATDAAELESTFAELLSNAGCREKLGQNALKAVPENPGAVDRTVEMVINGIKDSGVYVAPL